MSDYDKPVKFTNTNGCVSADEDAVYTVADFKDWVKGGAFIDYDGFGHPVKDELCDEKLFIKPSRLHEIPSDATHIVWYNR